MRRVFGYVRVFKPPMACGDYDLYRGVYCSLCGALGRRYGPLARLTLRYDMAFYALLALQGGGEVRFEPSTCCFHPLSKRLRCNHAALEAAADVSVLLAYYKWLDNLRDSAWYAKPLWALPGLFFLWASRRARRRAPEAERVVRVAVTASRLQEGGVGRRGSGVPEPCCPPPDACPHASAHALGALCALLEPGYYRLGYLLGRWVYLMDAADDYEGDVRHGRFNVFSLCGCEPKELVRATSAELAREWNALDVKRFRPILENILTLGLADMERRIFEEGETIAKSV